MASYPLGINPKTEKQYKVMIVDDSSTIRIAEKKYFYPKILMLCLKLTER